MGCLVESRSSSVPERLLLQALVDEPVSLLVEDFRLLVCMGRDESLHRAMYNNNYVSTMFI